MRFVSWNVNGLRACVGKGFVESALSLAADFVCLQETKMEPSQADIALPGYESVWSSAVKKGYSGTAIFYRAETPPISVAMDIGVAEHDQEGRVIRLEYPDFYLVDCYTPNAQRELTRLDYRMRWEDDFRAYLCALDAQKPVILCGDLNVAHEEIDLKHPKSNRGNAGFTDEERAKMTELLASGFADTFRRLHPDARDAYSWWSYMRNARANNAGWRIDYFIVSERILPRVSAASIHPQIMGSDHCPVSIDLI